MMKLQNSHLTKEISINMLRDEFPVIFSNPGKPAAFRKHFAAARNALKGQPLAKDPALTLTKTRNARALA